MVITFAAKSKAETSMLRRLGTYYNSFNHFCCEFNKKLIPIQFTQASVMNARWRQWGILLSPALQGQQQNSRKMVYL